jgi:hypothetical protein
VTDGLTIEGRITWASRLLAREDTKEHPGEVQEAIAHALVAIAQMMQASRTAGLPVTDPLDLDFVEPFAEPFAEDAAQARASGIVDPVLLCDALGKERWIERADLPPAHLTGWSITYDPKQV